MILGPSEDLPEQKYLIGKGTQEYSITELANEPFRPEAALCGEVMFTAELYELVDDIGATQQVDITDAGSYLKFNSDGSFSIETNEFAYEGTKELRIRAILIEHPDTKTQEDTILLIDFSRCQLKIHEWYNG